MNDVTGSYFQHYRCCGLRIASAIALDGFERGTDAADVTINFGATPEHLDAVLARGTLWSANKNEVLIDTPGVARYWIANGTTITIEPLSAAGREQEFLIGIPLAACLMQRGSMVLHGSGVMAANGALLFAGANGAGKSSLVAALAQNGYPVICDNLAAIEFRDQRAHLHRGTSSLRLWEDMALALGLDVASATPVREDMRKFTFMSASGSDGSITPIAAVFCMEITADTKPQLRRLHAAEAVAAVLKNHFRAKLARVYGETHLVRAVALAESVPVYLLSRPARGGSPADLAAFVTQSLGMA